MTGPLLYKVTDTLGHATHGGSFAYTLPTADGPGEWTPVITPVSLCRTGYHVTSMPMDWARIGMRVWDVEVAGLSDEIDDDQHKRVAESIRLTTERPDLIPSWWRSVEDFVATIGTTQFLDQHGEPDPSWKVFDTRDAAGAAAWDAARDAAWAAAWAAAGAAARAAAWDAAGAAAWDAAGAAAGAAARDAAWAAAWDARLMAQVLVCDGTDLDPTHRATAEQRWEVWRRGFGLYAEVSGQLFVYRRLA